MTKQVKAETDTARLAKVAILILFFLLVMCAAFT